jgi:hypothetical protein
VLFTATFLESGTVFSPKEQRKKPDNAGGIKDGKEEISKEINKKSSGRKSD